MQKLGACISLWGDEIYIQSFSQESYRIDQLMDIISMGGKMMM